MKTVIYRFGQKIAEIDRFAYPFSPHFLTIAFSLPLKRNKAIHLEVIPIHFLVIVSTSTFLFDEFTYMDVNKSQVLLLLVRNTLLSQIRHKATELCPTQS